jgi:hypothetical protein
MIPRKVCLFPLDNLTPAAARIQSWMLLVGNRSEIKHTCIGGQFPKVAHHA